MAGAGDGAPARVAPVSRPSPWVTLSVQFRENVADDNGRMCLARFDGRAVK
jgi:hypothetical protein